MTEESTHKKTFNELEQSYTTLVKLQFQMIERLQDDVDFWKCEAIRQGRINVNGKEG